MNITKGILRHWQDAFNVMRLWSNQVIIGNGAVVFEYGNQWSTDDTRILEIPQDGEWHTVLLCLDDIKAVHYDVRPGLSWDHDTDVVSLAGVRCEYYECCDGTYMDITDRRQFVEYRT